MKCERREQVIMAKKKPNIVCLWPEAFYGIQQTKKHVAMGKFRKGARM